ncbi:hypothetical protein HanXRQr2_Chr06g0258741 [Helianthus annuus]|uniref:Uncharacterized protein n=1 Tax=Helianthus annuus TaxID=4232 RepID=A0A9K3NJX7_HELAN|nr:hypothetical protein HanXRQr2_Chr06g0258741 [Helianthus annuus]
MLPFSYTRCDAMPHRPTVLIFQVSPPPSLDRLDSTTVSTRSRTDISRLFS